MQIKIRNYKKNDKYRLNVYRLQTICIFLQKYCIFRKKLRLIYMCDVLQNEFVRKIYKKQKIVENYF